MFVGKSSIKKPFSEKGMRKILFFGMICIVLVSLFALNIGVSADTKIDKDSIKEIKYSVYSSEQLIIHGTEYKAGEMATIFLQLKDANNNPIKNGSCYLDMFAPNKTAIFHDAPMLYLAYSDGLYFYDYALPASTGLYMISAQCSYSQYIRHYYTLTAGGWNPFETTSCGANEINITVNTGGVAQGTPISLNNLMEGVYVFQSSGLLGGAKLINTTFLWNATQMSCKINKTNTQSLSFYYMGETYNQLTMDFYALNWINNTWKYIGSIQTVGKASATATTGIEDYFSAKLDLTNHTAFDGSVKIMVYVTSGAVFAVWYDWLGLVASTNTTDMVDLKGSGEIHLSGAEGIFQACSMITDKDQYFPSENVRLTYFSGTSPTRLKIILLNGSVYYDSGLVNGTGAFSFNFTVPSSKQSILLELLCGNSFAHKFIIIDKTFWDIPFEPLVFLAIGIIVLLIGVMFFASKRPD